MNWIILIIAGLCECGFTFCLGKAKLATGWEAAGWYEQGSDFQAVDSPNCIWKC
jgi:hypothetical protein